ncbi:MAG TPA: S9 family peptidase [Verrucomicrobiae bacterium]|nr:S9 family peptidase [Verrucomicrobiae bacterium]
MRSFRSLAAGALVCALLAPGVAEARAFGFDDYYSIVAVESPQLSPDGKQVAVIVSRTDAKADRRHHELVLINVSDGAQRALTHDRDDVDAPQWSPDGTKLAFVDVVTSGKDESAQVWVMPMDGGDAHPVTTAKNSVEAYAWCPDGKAIAFVSPDDPANADALKAHDQLWTVGNNSYLLHAAPVPSHLWLQTIGGEPQRLTHGTWSVYPDQLSWSADGKYIAFSRMPDAYHDSLFKTRVAVYDVATKDVSLVGDDRWSWMPAFAPSGERLAYQGAAHHSVVLQQNLVTSAPGSHDVHDVVPALDRNVEYLAWLHHGDDLVVAGNDAVTTPLWIVSDGKAQRVAMGDVLFAGSASTAAGAIAFIGATPQDPGELYYLAPGAPGPRRLTDFNASIASLELGSSREITWKNDGFDEDGVLTYPAGYDKSKAYPLLLVIHGGPTFGASTLAFDPLVQVLAAHGYVVLQPNYRGSDNLGFTYAHAIIGETPPLGAGSDCIAGMKAVQRELKIDPARIGVSGWSAGGWLTSWLITHYDYFKAAVTGAAVDDAVMQYTLSEIDSYMADLFGGLTPWTARGMEAYRKASPVTYAANVKAATLILSDDNDPRVPTPEAYEFYSALRDQGKTVEFVAARAYGHHPSDPVQSMAIDRVWAQWFFDHIPTN